jgi:membrane protein YdbS with pleckstrin-like domain
MNNRFVLSHIRRLPLFERVASEQLPAIATIVQIVRAEPGMLLVKQGQPAQAMFLFVSGRALLTRLNHQGIEAQVGSVGEGQYVGEEALYSERIEPHSIHVVEPAVVLVIPKRALASVIAQYPELRANIGMQQVATRHQVKLFEGQRADETVQHIYKRHWWVFARKLWLPLLLATALIVGAGLAAQTLPALALILLGAAVIVPGGLALVLYADWQDDCLIVTEDRVIKIVDEILIFEKRVNEIPLERVLEINLEIPPDPFARLFNYGNIAIKTAGTGGNITMATMANPAEIQRVIFSARDRQRQSSTQRQRQAIEQELDKAFGVGTAQQPAASEPDPPSRRGFNPFRTYWVESTGERVYRHHLTVWGRHVALPLLVMMGAVMLGSASLIVPSLQAAGVIGLLVAALLFAFGVFWLYLADWDWRNDYLIIGRDMVTIIRKRPLWLQNEREQIRLSQIDNVVSEVNGLFDTLLRRGNIRISLIGGDVADAKRFNGVGSPELIQSAISEQMARIQREQQIGALPGETIAEYLAAYHARLTGQAAPQDPAASAYVPPSYSPPSAPDAPPPQVRDGSRPPGVPRIQE